MPQSRIPLEPCHLYHVWTHANGSENLFRADENYRYFLDKYKYYIQPVAETFAYCLMPNHLHLMIRVRPKNELIEILKLKKKRNLTLQNHQNFNDLVSQHFSNLFNAYAKAYNKKYDRMGSLFKPNFERKLVNSEEYFIRLITYIHYNPIHHGFVNELNEWPFSSWHAYFLNLTTSFINKEEGMSRFGNKKAFLEMHRRVEPETLKTVFE